MHVSCVTVIGDCAEVDLCTSIVGFVFCTVVGVDDCPDFPCCDTVPPQLPLLIISPLELESDVGFRQEFQIDACQCK